MIKNLFKINGILVLFCLLTETINAQIQNTSSFGAAPIDISAKTQISEQDNVPVIAGKDILFSESFDATNFPPAGWLNVAGSGTYIWTRVTSGVIPTCLPHSGAGMALYNSNVIPGGNFASLITPAINLTGNTGTHEVRFWMRHSTFYTNADQIQVYINTDATLNGATLLGNVLLNNDTSSWKEHFFMIPAIFNTETNYFIFKAISAWGENIHIDDISINSPFANDVGIIAIIAPNTYVNPGTAVAPQVTVKNFGTTVQNNIPVKYKNGYAGTVNTVMIPSLSAGATTNVSFPYWFATNGNYNFIFYTDMTTDQFRANDTLKRTVNVLTLRTYYGYNINGNSVAVGPIKIQYPSGIITSIGPPLPTTNSFITGSTFIETPIIQKWWVCEYSTTSSAIYICDTLTGAFTTISPGCGLPLTGITYNTINDVLYGSVYTTNSTLCSINRSTGIATPIGTGSTDGIIIDIACNTGGSLYAINISHDMLYSINKNTGAGTPIGPLGVNINYAQGMTINRNENLMIGALFTTYGSFGRINFNTGTYTQDIVTNCQIDGISIPYSFVGINNDISNLSDALEVYPNPANNVVSIIAGYDQSIETIKVLNIAGQIILNKQVNGYITQIDVNNYENGMYIMQVKTNKGFYTKKITVAK